MFDADHNRKPWKPFIAAFGDPEPIWAKLIILSWEGALRPW